MRGRLSYYWNRKSRDERCQAGEAINNLNLITTVLVVVLEKAVARCLIVCAWMNNTAVGCGGAQDESDGSLYQYYVQQLFATEHGQLLNVQKIQQ